MTNKVEIDTKLLGQLLEELITRSGAPVLLELQEQESRMIAELDKRIEQMERYSSAATSASRLAIISTLAFLLGACVAAIMNLFF